MRKYLLKGSDQFEIFIFADDEGNIVRTEPVKLEHPRVKELVNDMSGIFNGSLGIVKKPTLIEELIEKAKGTQWIISEID